MSEKKGIENTKIVVDLFAELGNVADDISRGGSIGKALLKLLGEVVALKDLDKDELRLEFGDLSGVEKEELIEHFSKKFDLKNDYAELLIERALDVLTHEGLALVKKVLAIRDILKDGKAETVKKVSKKKSAEKPVEAPEK